MLKYICINIKYIYIYMICCGQDGLAVVWAVGSGLRLWPGHGYHMAAEAMPQAAVKLKW